MALDIKAKIEEIVSKIKNDKSLGKLFKKDPVKAVKGIVGELPEDQIKAIIEGVKGKINVGGFFGKLKNLFKKKK